MQEIGNYIKIVEDYKKYTADQGVANKTIKHGDDLQKLNKITFSNFLASLQAPFTSVAGEIKGRLMVA